MLSLYVAFTGGLAVFAFIFLLLILCPVPPEQKITMESSVGFSKCEVSYKAGTVTQVCYVVRDK